MEDRLEFLLFSCRGSCGARLKYTTGVPNVMTSNRVASVVTKLSWIACTSTWDERELRKPGRVPYAKSATRGRATNVTTTANAKKTIRNTTVLLSVPVNLAIAVREDENLLRGSFKDCISLSRKDLYMISRTFDFLGVLPSSCWRPHLYEANGLHKNFQLQIPS